MSQDIIERLARIETHLESLVGNGQPGRIKLIEDKVETLQASRSWYMGAMAVISAGVSLVGTWLFTHLFAKP